MSEPRARLLCRTGELAGATYELGTGGTIGRDATNDVVLLAETVSGRHARIYREDGAYFLEDVGSSNGTLVDGIPVTTAVQLSTLNVITFSEAFDVIFQIMGEDQPARTSPTQPDPPAAASPPPPSTPARTDEPPPPAPPPSATADRTRVDLEAFAMPVLGEATPEPTPEPEPTTEPEPTYVLIVRIGDGAPIEYSLQSGNNTLGRSDDCDVTVNHESLSRTHASIDVTQDGLVLKDLGSTNGTYIDNAAITETTLADTGDFKLGAEVDVKVKKR